MSSPDAATMAVALKGVEADQLIYIFMSGLGIAFMFVLLVLWLIKINMKAIDKIPEQLEKLTQAFYDFSAKSVSPEDVQKEISIALSQHERDCPCFKMAPHSTRK